MTLTPLGRRPYNGQLQAGLVVTRAVQNSLVNKLLSSDAVLYSAANLTNSISE